MMDIASKRLSEDARNYDPSCQDMLWGSAHDADLFRLLRIECDRQSVQKALNNSMCRGPRSSRNPRLRYDKRGQELGLARGEKQCSPAWAVPRNRREKMTRLQQPRGALCCIVVNLASGTSLYNCQRRSFVWAKLAGVRVHVRFTESIEV
jgi:hypothetical protein